MTFWALSVTADYPALRMSWYLPEEADTQERGEAGNKNGG